MLNIDLRAGNGGGQNRSLVSNSQTVIPMISSKPKDKSGKSLNRGQRIQELSSIVQGNRIMLKKLQDTKSNYSTKMWEEENRQNKTLKKLMAKNSDRFCTNAYFLHSVCTAEDSYYVTLCKFLQALHL